MYEKDRLVLASEADGFLGTAVQLSAGFYAERQRQDIVEIHQSAQG